MSFEEVYDRYFARVYGYVRCRVASRDEADDVVSRVFERVLDRLGSYDERRGPFEPWLFTVARNALADHFRWRSLRSLLPLELAGDRPEPEADSDRGLIESESRAQLLRALRRLEDREREILALKFEALMSHREIAQTTGLTESHVGVIVFRAVRRLKEALG